MDLFVKITRKLIEIVISGHWIEINSQINTNESELF